MEPWKTPEEYAQLALEAAHQAADHVVLAWSAYRGASVPEIANRVHLPAKKASDAAQGAAAAAGMAFADAAEAANHKRASQGFNQCHARAKSSHEAALRRLVEAEEYARSAVEAAQATASVATKSVSPPTMVVTGLKRQAAPRPRKPRRP